MPYNKISELPENLRDILPKHAKKSTSLPLTARGISIKTRTTAGATTRAKKWRTKSRGQP